MSVSSEVKRELLKISGKGKCCRKAFLSAVFLFCGREGADGFSVKLENAELRRKTAALLRTLYNVSPAETDAALLIPQGRAFQLVFGDLNLLEKGALQFRISPFLSADECCPRAFLRGAFLCAGAMSDPEKSYHFELETHRLRLSRDLEALLDEADFSFGRVARKSKYVLYLKDSEAIGDALAYMGASKAALSLYSVKTEREMNNAINRRVNCETHNISKTVETSLAQIAGIRRIQAKIGLDALAPKLRALAVLRLENPEASLLELGAALEKPIGKSGVNNRFRKLKEIWEGLE
jgi:DNA-binding protein WhiA